MCIREAPTSKACTPKASTSKQQSKKRRKRRQLIPATSKKSVQMTVSAQPSTVTEETFLPENQIASRGATTAPTTSAASDGQRVKRKFSNSIKYTTGVRLDHKNLSEEVTNFLIISYFLNL